MPQSRPRPWLNFGRSILLLSVMTSTAASAGVPERHAARLERTRSLSFAIGWASAHQARHPDPALARWLENAEGRNALALARVDAWRGYLESYPDGMHAAAVVQAFCAHDRAAAEKRGDEAALYAIAKNPERYIGHPAPEDCAAEALKTASKLGVARVGVQPSVDAATAILTAYGTTSITQPLSDWVAKQRAEGAVAVSALLSGRLSELTAAHELLTAPQALAVLELGIDLQTSFEAHRRALRWCLQENDLTAFQRIVPTLPRALVVDRSTEDLIRLWFKAHLARAGVTATANRTTLTAAQDTIVPILEASGPFRQLLTAETDAAATMVRNNFETGLSAGRDVEAYTWLTAGGWLLRPTDLENLQERAMAASEERKQREAEAKRAQEAARRGYVEDEIDAGLPWCVLADDYDWEDVAIKFAGTDIIGVPIAGAHQCVMQLFDGSTGRAWGVSSFYRTVQPVSDGYEYHVPTCKVGPWTDISGYWKCRSYQGKAECYSQYW